MRTAEVQSRPVGSNSLSQPSPGTVERPGTLRHTRACDLCFPGTGLDNREQLVSITVKFAGPCPGSDSEDQRRTRSHPGTVWHLLESEYGHIGTGEWHPWQSWRHSSSWAPFLWEAESRWPRQLTLHALRRTAPLLPFRPPRLDNGRHQLRRNNCSHPGQPAALV